MSSKGLGQKLKDRRMELGLSLKDVEVKTKIRSSYIDAFEQEHFSFLDKIYIVGFLKSYARVLNLDTDEVFSHFNVIWESSIAAKAYNKDTFKEKSRFQISRYTNNEFLRFVIITINRIMKTLLLK